MYESNAPTYAYLLGISSWVPANECHQESSWECFEELSIFFWQNPLPTRYPIPIQQPTAFYTYCIETIKTNGSYAWMSFCW